MLVILRENVDNLGRIGDVVKVSDGYARNFLLPRNLVVTADEKNVAMIEHHKRSLEKKRLAQRGAAEELAKKLNDFSCTITRKAGEHDKLFGSVGSGDIADALKKAGYQIEKRVIHLEHAIKTLGVHPVTIKLEPEVTATLKVWVVKEE
ncbi:MAG: 50S ribosomal protein L9 [Bdellovibrionales bacterium GWB1_55_8]|nr:MAG: 50S ribosomal protein L9 [Bdellovibrionales bacterium GWB1_55_8]